MADTVKLSRQTWNKLDPLTKEATRVVGGLPPVESRRDLIYIQNDSGYDISQLGILGLNGLVVTPTDNAELFMRRPIFSGKLPAVNEFFVICCKPLAQGAVGPAFFSGVCPVRISCTDEHHTHAEPADSDYSALASAESGPAEIIWTEIGTGTLWAIVRLKTVSQGASEIHPAYCKTAAGTGNTLICYLYENTTGVEITVYFNLTGRNDSNALPTNLSTCLPQLEVGTKIWVAYDSIVGRWEYVGGPVIGTEDCN